MKTPHILIIRFSAMGDIAMTVPIVYSLAKQYPDVRISVLSRPFAKPFFQHLAPNVEFMAADLKKEYKGFRGLNTLYRRLVAKQFTAVADFHNVLRTRYLRLRFLLGGYSVAHINKHKQGKERLCRKENKVFIQQPTSFQNYADVLEVLGYPIKPEFTSIFPTEGGDLQHLPNIIGVKQPEERWIGIAPFAAHAGKMYPQERMEQVVRKLTETHPSWRIFLFGGGKQEIEVWFQWIVLTCTLLPSLVHEWLVYGVQPILIVDLWVGNRRKKMPYKSIRSLAVPVLSLVINLAIVATLLV